MKAVIPIVIAILSVIIIFSGCVSQTDNNTNNASGQSITTKDAFMGALSSGLELKCGVDSNGMPITVYFTQDKYLALATTPIGDVHSIMDVKAKMIYIWSNQEMFTQDQLASMNITVEPGKKIGVKMDFSQQSTKILTAEDFKPEWNCTLSTDPIVLPTEYQFIDLTKIMPQQGQDQNVADQTTESTN